MLLMPILSMSFNSTMVRLKVENYDVFPYLDTGFNSTMVRLKVTQLAGQQFASRSFNSTMVRLKASQHHFYRVDDVRFQFHNGSIKSEPLGL